MHDYFFPHHLSEITAHLHPPLERPEPDLSAKPQSVRPLSRKETYAVPTVSTK